MKKTKMGNNVIKLATLLTMLSLVGMGGTAAAAALPLAELLRHKKIKGEILP